MKKTRINHQQFVEMWNNDVPAIKIAEKFGVSMPRVSTYALEHREECPKRKNIHNLKSKKIVHEEFVKLWNEGKSVTEIAEKFGACKQTVSKYAQRNSGECSKRKQGKKKQINHAEFVKLWNSDVPVAEISKKLGTKKEYVPRYARLHRDECIKRMPRRKVIYEEFEKMWNSGAEAKEIAERFDISVEHVYNYAIKNRNRGLKNRNRKKNRK